LRHAKLVFPVAWISQHLGIDAERNVVDERAAIDAPYVHAPFVATGGEGIESAQRADEIQPEIAGKVVQGARGHHQDGQSALHGHPRHRCHRPVAAGHGERLRTSICCLDGGVPRILSGLKHPHSHPALTGGPGQAPQ
jgi:hypothetical protein